MIGGTLAVVTAEFDSGPQLLLGEKQYGPDEGKLVPPGGKLIEEFMEPESPIVVAVEYAPYGVVREVEEETGVRLAEDETFCVGMLLVSKCVAKSQRPEFYDVTDEFAISIYRSYISKERAKTLKLQPSEELKPLWVSVDKPPYSRMQTDMPLWLPSVLSAKPGDRLFGDVTLSSDKVFEHHLFFGRAGERMRLLPTSK